MCHKQENVPVPVGITSALLCSPEKKAICRNNTVVEVCGSVCSGKVKVAKS